MDVTQPTQQVASTPPAPSAASTQIGSDFEVFLQMLTAQMKYQDPLNPVDSTDYATQLATFSGVEQAVLTNDLLKSLTTQMNTGGLVDMAALVGKQVKSTAPAYFDGQPLTLLPAQNVAADTAELVVRNEAGDEVQRTAIDPGAQTLEWAGVSPNGSPFAAGIYQFEIVSKSGDDIIAQTPVETYSTVNEVRLEGSATILVLSGGVSVASDQVTALRESDT
ncbi:flagellar hook capping FlgD N-terminal domain-containing protein [Roseobacter sp. CCS2]|uniref:flagellar hook capping FlgD N-terminal domain-containing protein n=1 Tax=Roseobacter sp. CCS2 TaxID=391593 RepID=UPI0000F401DE|nr:flagellar hook capping FlgD N-terminal domain-containing protein [Roseobacter sp. CCS2]EBA13822.1 flagellar basal-body rod modification protein, putative [Roseobacter sp. CCS2]